MKPIHNHPCAMPPDKDWRNCIVPEDEWDGDTLIPQQLERYRNSRRFEEDDAPTPRRTPKKTKTKRKKTKSIQKNLQHEFN